MSAHALFTWVIAAAGVAAMLSLCFLDWPHEKRPEKGQDEDERDETERRGDMETRAAA